MIEFRELVGLSLFIFGFQVLIAFHLTRIADALEKRNRRENNGNGKETNP